MPLSIEQLSNKDHEWFKIHHAGPEDFPTVLPQVLPDGEKKMYVLQCDESDFFSYMYTFSVPPDISTTTDVVNLIGCGELKPIEIITIEKGDNYYYAIKSKEEGEREIVVFSHE